MSEEHLKERHPPLIGFHETSLIRENSDWECHIFGGELVYIPKKGHEPNRFSRWMMKICFDCRWIKKEKEKAE